LVEDKFFYKRHHKLIQFDKVNICSIKLLFFGIMSVK